MNLFGWFGKKGRDRGRDARRAAGRARPQVEALEDRRVLSLGTSFGVSPFDNSDQFAPAAASIPKGPQVVVWVERPDSVGDTDIRGRLFGPGGKVLRTFAVARSSLDESEPSVAMDNQGRFVVTWTRETASGQTDVLVQRFDAAANKLGGPVKVAASALSEFDSDVAVDAKGNFVVSYTVQVSATNNDVRARRFGPASNPVGALAVATAANFNEHSSSVAMAPNGRFLVAFARDQGNLADVVVQRYNAQAALQGVVEIDQANRDERAPDVAINKFGDGVVVYMDKIGDDLFNVKARRVFNTGTVGNVIGVGTDISLHELLPAVAMNRSSGSFVVGYNVIDDTDFRMEVAEVSEANNVTIRDDFLKDDTNPALAFTDEGKYLVTYTAEGFLDRNIRGRRGVLA
jgi:hypothetical protein